MEVLEDRGRHWASSLGEDDVSGIKRSNNFSGSLSMSDFQERYSGRFESSVEHNEAISRILNHVPREKKPLPFAREREEQDKKTPKRTYQPDMGRHSFEHFVDDLGLVEYVRRPAVEDKRSEESARDRVQAFIRAQDSFIAMGYNRSKWDPSNKVVWDATNIHLQTIIPFDEWKEEEGFDKFKNFADKEDNAGHRLIAALQETREYYSLDDIEAAFPDPAYVNIEKMLALDYTRNYLVRRAVNPVTLVTYYGFVRAKVPENLVPIEFVKRGYHPNP